MSLDMFVTDMLRLLTSASQQDQENNSEGESDTKEDFVPAHYSSSESSESENLQRKLPMCQSYSAKFNLDTALQHHFHDIETVFIDCIT